MDSTCKIVTLFNHKGGVSKTTTTFNLGWMLAEQGKRVILVDADPQCNLTGMVLDLRGPNELDKFYGTESKRNIMAGLAPAFESRPELIQGIDCIEVSGQPGLFLLPGHLRLSEYEVTLGIAQELTAAIQTLQNLPGSLSYLLRKTAETQSADFVLVDMSPSLSSINQNLLVTSDFFIVPTSPDYFSAMAIESLTTVLPRWHKWAQQEQKMEVLRNAAYPFPETTPRLLGTIIQRYRLRERGQPAVAFQSWITEVNLRVNQRLAPALEKIGMLLPKRAYECQGMESYCLSTISDFNSLIAKSQEARVPVFALTDQQIGQSGIVLERTLRAQKEFTDAFRNLSDKVQFLTGYDGDS